MARLGSWIEPFPEGIYGREDALMHWCMTRQIKSRELNLVGYEDEDD